MPKAVLLTGTNLGDRHINMETVCGHINDKAGKILSRSIVYETAPWGFKSENYFLNQAVVIETELSPRELLGTVQEIEARMGRDNKNSVDAEGNRTYESRIMDIDIIFYDDVVMDTDDLTIPHPLACKRKFVLDPLKEIMGDFIHPVTGERISEIIPEEDPRLGETPLGKKE